MIQHGQSGVIRGEEWQGQLLSFFSPPGSPEVAILSGPPAPPTSHHITSHHITSHHTTSARKAPPDPQGLEHLPLAGQKLLRGSLTDCKRLIAAVAPGLY